MPLFHVPLTVLEDAVDGPAARRQVAKKVSNIVTIGVAVEAPPGSILVGPAPGGGVLNDPNSTIGPKTPSEKSESDSNP